MPKVPTSLGRAATDVMLACDRPFPFTPHWQASAVEAGRRAGLADAEIADMTGFVATTREAGDADPGSQAPPPGPSR